MSVIEALSKSWRPAPTWRGSGWATYLPAGIVGLILAALVIPPIYILIRISLTKAGVGGAPDTWTLAQYASLFADPELYTSAANSIEFAALSMVLSLVIGGVLAWVVERTDAPFRPLAYMTTVVSLGTPYILYVSAWLFLLGNIGPFNQFYRFVTGATDNLVNVYSIGGMVFIEGVLWSPLAFMLMSATFRRANAEMEEAARMSGASVFQTVWRVSLRLAAPTILGLAIFIFISNLESFDAPVLIGMPQHINLLTTDIYVGMTAIPPDLNRSSAFACVMIAAMGVLLLLYSRVSRSADRYASVTGKGFRPRPFALGKWRWLGGAVILLHFFFVLVLPLVGVLWVSLVPFLQPISLNGLRAFTLEHYFAVFNQSTYLGMAVNTIVASALAATVTVALTGVAGWLTVRRWPGAQILEQLTGVPLVFPGVVLGVAMAEIALTGPLPIYDTVWLIALAFAIRYLPYGIRYAYTGAIQIHRELEEAAGISGANQTTILRRIVAPLLSPALSIEWLFLFLIGARELSVAVLLSGAQTQTMAVAIFDQWSNGDGGEVAALGIGWTVFMTACTGVMYLVVRRQSQSLAGIFGQ